MVSLLEKCNSSSIYKNVISAGLIKIINVQHDTNVFLLEESISSWIEWNEECSHDTENCFLYNKSVTARLKEMTNGTHKTKNCFFFIAEI